MAHYIGRLVDNFSHVVADFADASSKAFKDASQQNLSGQCHHQEISSAATLAQVDLMMLDWVELHNEAIPADSHTFASKSVTTIERGLCEAQAGYLACTDRWELQPLARVDTTPMRDAAARIEQLVDSVKLKEGVNSIGDDSESRLDSGIILNPRIAACLDVLRATLGQQLSSCGHQHVVRLKLTGFSEDFDHQMRLVLDLFLSSRFDWTPCRWLQSRCTIVKSLGSTEARGCHFIKDTELEKHSLALRISEQPLGHLIRDPTNTLADSTFPTVSLGFLIDERYFNTTWGGLDHQNRTFLPLERANLCFVLAKSLSHLSSGARNRIKWDIDGIFFLEDHSTQMLLDKNKPYLSWELESSGANGFSYNSHLVDFARLLMEVHAGERIRFDGHPEELQPFLYTLMNDQRRFMSPQKEKFRFAVEACLGPAGKEAAQDQSDPERFKTFLFQKVLPHLETCSNVYMEPQLERNETSIDPQSLRSDISILREQKSPYDSQAYDKPKDHFAAEGAEEFLRRMELFNKEHIIPVGNERPYPKLPAHLEPRIKIAIIDSGIKLEDTRIVALNQNCRIQEKRNFLPGPADAWHDDHGHGTHVAWLVLKMAPRAEVYIAKVSDAWHIDKNNVSCIAQAVNWAVQEWQVDIITMSLVLNDPNEAIKAALMQAVNPSCEGLRRRIVFAAAGNNGGMDPMPWPASLQLFYPGIIPIHATDGMGNAMNINPTTVRDSAMPRYLSLESFATLGRDIKSRWKTKGAKPKDVFISGTSFATPIAAAIAADVLEYARWNMSLTKEQKALLYSGVYMRKIFARMAEKRGDYHYVQPWTLWNQGCGNGFGQSMKIREVLQDVIAN